MRATGRSLRICSQTLCGIAGYSLGPESAVERAEAGMTVDSEIIFALAEVFRGRTATALEQLYGTMATAWLDEGRPELIVARGLNRPLWLGKGKHELVFASARVALELVESYA